MTWPAWLPRRPHLPFGKPPCPDRAGWRGLSALLLMHEISLHRSDGPFYTYHDHDPFVGLHCRGGPGAVNRVSDDFAFFGQRQLNKLISCNSNHLITRDY